MTKREDTERLQDAAAQIACAVAVLEGDPADLEVLRPDVVRVLMRAREQVEAVSQGPRSS